MVSITLLGSILRIKAKTASLISASISCSLEAPALMTAASTYHSKTSSNQDAEFHERWHYAITDHQDFLRLDKKPCIINFIRRLQGQEKNKINKLNSRVPIECPTSIKSLLAPSEIAARLSYCSGSKSFRAAVRYSPAGVVLTKSVPVLTNVIALSFFSEARGEPPTPGRPLALVLSFLLKRIQMEDSHGSVRSHSRRKQRRQVYQEDIAKENQV